MGEEGASNAQFGSELSASKTGLGDGIGEHDGTCLTGNLATQAKCCLVENLVQPLIQKLAGTQQQQGMKLRLKELLEERQLKQVWLVNKLDLSPGYVSHLVGNTRTPSPALLARLADAFGVPVAQLMADRPPVAVAGRIGAGAAVELVDAYPKGDGLYHVAAPEDLPASQIVAVEVVGDSMEPLIEEGDIIFFTRHFVGIDDAAVGHVAIVCTEDGRALVKKIVQGREPGSFDLYSINPSTPPEYGVKLSWAAPWRRHLRRQDVEIISG